MLALSRQPMPLQRREPDTENKSARGAYVLRGRRLVGSVTTGEILKKIAGGK